MRFTTVCFSLAALYALSGCGGSVAASDTSTIRSIGKELHITDLKKHYYLGEKFDGTFRAVDEYGADISRYVEVSGSVDTSVEGRYTLLFRLYDSERRLVDTQTQDIVVTANHAPVITLYGGARINLYLDHAYDEPGFEATDAEDGDLRAQVQISSDVDSSQEGIYHVVYRVTDSYGNRVSKTREVHVIPPDDIRAQPLSESTADPSATYRLWDYLIDKSSDAHLYTSYRNNKKDHTQTNSFTQRDLTRYDLTVPYSLRNIRYTDNGDDTIAVDFMQGADRLQSVLLQNSLHLDDIITVERPVDASGACRLTDHFDAIMLADRRYDDVIRIRCGAEEAYFEKAKGIILRNHLSDADGTLAVSGYLPKLRTITDIVKIPLGEYNLESMRQSHTDMLASDPYNLHGRGIRVGIVDEGAVRVTHQELTGRVTNLTSESISDHTTHVAGTIAATGIDADARGYANEATLDVISYYDTKTGIDNNPYPLYFHYAIDELRLKGVYISNHSYGDANSSSAGVYGTFSFETDKLVERYPDILAVASAGNDRGTEGYSHYGIIKDFNNAKNLITVGAVSYDGRIAPFSSTGPAAHGRIKPDVVAKGYRVLSLDSRSDDGYIEMSGTSMAAPAVTGALALLEEAYLRVNHTKMREDTAKALITNTAEDLGREGPDYEYGFGLLNTLDAVKAIDSMKSGDALVQLQRIAAEQKQSYDLHLNRLTTFKATLCWIDPERGFVSDGALVSDLDLTIVDRDFHTVYSYSLDPDNPEAAATQNGFNRVDNVEQIVAKLPKGDYKVIVTVHKAGREQQPYTLVSNIPLKNLQTDSSYTKIREFETTIYESVAAEG